MNFDDWWQKEYKGMSEGYGARDAWNAALEAAIKIAQNAEIGMEAGCHYGEEIASDIEKLRAR